MTDSKPIAMKKIRIILNVRTQSEYTEVIEIPEDTPLHEINELVDQRFRDVDGGEYHDDECYWEKGECWFDFNHHQGHEEKCTTFMPAEPAAINFPTRVWNRIN